MKSLSLADGARLGILKESIVVFYTAQRTLNVTAKTKLLVLEDPILSADHTWGKVTKYRALNRAIWKESAIRFIPNTDCMSFAVSAAQYTLAQSNSIPRSRSHQTIRLIGHFVQRPSAPEHNEAPPPSSCSGLCEESRWKAADARGVA